MLNRGGNAVTVSQQLAELLNNLSQGETLGSVLRAGKARGERTLVFGTVYPFSMHTLQLRRWLRSQDVNPDHDVRFDIVPPVRMVASLQSGLIDAFCVGEPYNSLAVQQGLGSIVATSNGLWPNAPEKVLGCTADWASKNPAVLNGLIRALGKACAWLESGVENRRQAAAWLSMSDHVNVDKALLEMALLARAEGAFNPYVQFDGHELGADQHSVFESLVVETHALTSDRPLTADQIASGLSVFGV